MSQKISKFLILFFKSSQIFNRVQKCPKFLMIFFFSHVQKNGKKCSPNFTSIHRFCLPSSTIFPYFNLSYYSFFTFLTLYPIFFNISQRNFSPKSHWGFEPPKPPLPTPLLMR